MCGIGIGQQDEEDIVWAVFVEIDGETQSVVTGLLGLTGETADSEGRIEGNVTFDEIADEDATLPDEFTFSIWGWYSECEVNQIVP